MRYFRFGLAIASALLAASCGHIAVYNDASLSAESRTGILYYPPKPYLLVSRTGAEDKPTDVQVIYLPDLSQPHYAVMSPGLGSSNLGLTFSNGVLVSANQESDPKIVEAITALAGVPLQLANAAKTRADAAAVVRPEASDFPALARVLDTVVTDLRAATQDSVAATVLNPSQITSLGGLAARVDEAAKALVAPQTTDSTVGPVVDTLEDIAEGLAAIKPQGVPGTATEAFWGKIRDADKQLNGVLTALKPKPAPPPTLTLYEILITGGGTTLREVPIATLGGAGAGRP